MSKIYFKSMQNCKITYTILLLLFCCTFFAQAKMSISYNDKIDLGNVPKETRFEITGDAKMRLKGNEINSYVFSKPGNYRITVTEKATHDEKSCDEMHLPKEILVTVSRIKMTFDTRNISLSAPIVKNNETNGIVLSIPVKVETYDHHPAAMNFSPVHSAGVATNIIANLDAKFKELSEGTHMLSYSLSGNVTQNSYLMFDFVDANGAVQSASLLTPIKG